VKVENPGGIDVVVLEGWMLGFRPVSSWSTSSSSLEQLYSAAAAAPESDETKRQLQIDYAPPFLLQHDLEHLQKVEEELKRYEELWKEVDVVAQIRPERMGYVWEWRLEVRFLPFLPFTLLTVLTLYSLSIACAPQQEHNMKAKNGGIGMTDEQVKTFISRFVPFVAFHPFSFLLSSLRIFVVLTLLLAYLGGSPFRHSLLIPNDSHPSPLHTLIHCPVSYMPGYELWLRGLSAAPWTGGKGLAVVIGKGREVLRTEEL
jgi:pantothenate kinase-related protein Tda10